MITVLLTIGDIGERTFTNVAEYEDVMEQLGKDTSVLIRLVLGIRHAKYEHHHKYHDHNMDFEDYDD